MKKLLYFVCGLLALFLIIPVFLPSRVTFSRTTEIHKTPQEVFNLVADFNYYMQWNPWSQLEPTAKTTISGTPKEPGHNWSWVGQEIGTGSLTIEKVDPGKSIESRLEFKDPMEAVAKDLWSFEPTSAGTKVTWTYAGDMSYPIGRYFGLAMEGQLGPDFEKGLANIKTLAESMPTMPDSAKAE
ncbi:MAG: SRPBCC family protein [Bacteroidetes bacterium]|nr:SRPBCC family protein [Bacteroidota bacterium]